MQHKNDLLRSVSRKLLFLGLTLSFGPLGSAFAAPGQDLQAGGDPAASSLADLSLVGGEVLGGTLLVESLTVPRGSRVYVEDDLRVSARSRIRIEGDLIVLPRSADQDLDAPLVELESARVIEVFGTIQGAEGAARSQEPNGPEHGRIGRAGSDLTLSAPVLVIDGQLLGGRGGLGAAGGKGGRGGHVEITGLSFSRRGGGESHLKGGAGGRPGLAVPGEPKAPDGGDGGDAFAGVGHFATIHPDGWWNVLEWADPQLLPPRTGAAGDPMNDCQNGAVGLDSLIVEGGEGSWGGQAADGTETMPNGQNGSVGGRGGSAFAPPGFPGRKGGDCCGEEPGTGGRGGDGGLGGTGIGGTGGVGGYGGDAYLDVSQGIWGNGGNAGKGGEGGSAMGTSGGKGGKGGLGLPGGGGGTGGMGGTSRGGFGGFAGVPGGGRVPGEVASDGDTGMSTGNKPDGENGAMGGSCPVSG